MVLVLPAPPVVRVETAARLSVFFLMPGTNAFPAVPFRTIGLALSALSAIFSTRCCTHRRRRRRRGHRQQGVALWWTAGHRCGHDRRCVDSRLWVAKLLLIPTQRLNPGLPQSGGSCWANNRPSRGGPALGGGVAVFAVLAPPRAVVSTRRVAMACVVPNGIEVAVYHFK